mmetsp:Transcript_13470/g.40642  ORF Transcript_13470/g.40642 Transcript_13470/m.40642 type:complete len:212 (-) Transcript_13470:134-769(-)
MQVLACQRHPAGRQQPPRHTRACARSCLVLSPSPPAPGAHSAARVICLVTVACCSMGRRPRSRVQGQEWVPVLRAQTAAPDYTSAPGPSSRRRSQRRSYWNIQTICMPHPPPRPAAVNQAAAARNAGARSTQCTGHALVPVDAVPAGPLGQGPRRVQHIHNHMRRFLWHPRSQSGARCIDPAGSANRAARLLARWSHQRPPHAPRGRATGG